MIVAVGHSRAYAPSTPEMAPDAPTVGTGEVGFARSCAKDAARPHAK